MYFVYSLQISFDGKTWRNTKVECRTLRRLTGSPNPFGLTWAEMEGDVNEGWPE